MRKGKVYQSPADVLRALGHSRHRFRHSSQSSKQARNYHSAGPDTTALWPAPKVKMSDAPKKRAGQRVAKLKHKAFARELMSNGMNPKEAYKAVYPTAGEGTIRVNSSRLMQSEDVKRELARKAEAVTPDLIVSSIADIAREGKKEDTRLRAWELLAKVRALMKNNDAPQQNINVLAQFDTPEARAALTQSNIQVTHTSHPDAIESQPIVPTIDTTHDEVSSNHLQS